jgi:hypothetical protein
MEPVLLLAVTSGRERSHASLDLFPLGVKEALHSLALRVPLVSLHHRCAAMTYSTEPTEPGWTSYRLGMRLPQ